MRSDAFLRAVVIVVFVAALEALCDLGVIPNAVMPAPSAMFHSMWDILAAGEFNMAIAVTLSSVAIALVASVVIGVALGALIYSLPRLRRALEPFLASYYAVPSFLLYPILILFLGVGRTSIIVLAVMMATVAIIVATLAGLDSVPRVFVRTAHVLRMGRTRIALLVQFPSAAPYLFSGVKLAVAYSFIGVLASEFILSGEGLGYNIADAYNQFDNRIMYGLMMLVIVVVTLINSVLHSMDQRLQARRQR
jgi:NitT/TauT family transport system permease protein